MLPVVSIIGRPNVGKSTLFNRLTNTRDALVDDTPGVTRDRLYGMAEIDGRSVLIVDTGGIGEDDDWISSLIRQQVDAVLQESDHVVLMVDATDGLMIADEDIADLLRKSNLPVTVAVNKSEGLDGAIASVDFHRLRYGEVVPVSARRGNGVRDMFSAIIESLPDQSDPLWQDPGPKVAVLGRPNVGKSTLINAIANDKRLIVSDTPGTTRDSVVVPLSRGGKRFRFIDTAGVRRRSRIGETLEVLSVIKSMRSIEAAHVAILVVDAEEGATDQDATLAGLILRTGRPLLVVVNKRDLVRSKHQRDSLERSMSKRLSFIRDDCFYVSGLKGVGIGKLVPAVVHAYRSSMVEMTTGKLNDVLQSAMAEHPPPRSGSRPIKLKYAHQGGCNPPVVVIHGNNVGKVPRHYKRFLEGYIEGAFRLSYVSVRVVFRGSSNPYSK